ncbi:uncharacterized protein NPIL_188311 [Nephila pilipes]|uniref:Integrase catalytic domain-containing protein n=1 Tax=Nephila pilipes TaxID=299642 RepID=A0A8X6UNM4_NEPPI|nr:uncharacterized protein NPIL_188311 [Nephila pilipes]
MVQYLPVSKGFDEVHLDIVSPLQSSEEKWYCVALIHRFMQWPEAIPVPDIQAVTVASAVYNGWNSCFGMPSVVITDQGSQFESNLFTKRAHVLGIKWKRTTANNPAFLLGLHSIYCKEFKCTPAECVYGTDIRLPRDFLHTFPNSTGSSEFVKELKQHFANLKPFPASRHSKRPIFILKELGSRQRAFVRTDSSRAPFYPPYEGPYEIKDKTDHYITLLVNGKEHFYQQTETMLL